MNLSVVLDWIQKINGIKYNIMEKKEPGTINVAKIKESVNAIEFLTKQYKRKRMSTEQYIKSVHENLSHLTTQRNYLEYLNNIGQN